MSDVDAPVATADLLLHKRPVEKWVTITLANGEGDPTEFRVKMRAIGTQEYDRMVTKHPPSARDKKDGLTYNINAFAPELIAACMVEPALSPDEAEELWKSPDWNRGEHMQLFLSAVEVNNRGLELPPTSSD